MWKDIVSLSDDKNQVIARLPKDMTLKRDFNQNGLRAILSELNAGAYFVKEDAVQRFVALAKEGKSESFHGIVIAEIRDASVEVVVTDNDMLASMIVTGAYGGKAPQGLQLIHALARASVTKGINKLALKKALAMGAKLSAGEQFTQAVAIGRKPIEGKNAKFIALVKDISKQVLAPVEDATGKVDMLNLGETINVAVGQPLMRRIPPTAGTPGLTVQGKVLPAGDGKDAPLREGKNSAISDSDPDVLVALISGMPILHAATVDVDEVLVMNSIGVATGHVKFKGNVIVRGNIESDMIVRATGNIVVSGFIESANVQAQGDIEVAKGIIGHNVSDGKPKSCSVKAGGCIKANYAQFSELQAGNDILLAQYGMNNEMRCGQNLTIRDETGRTGTLSGGTTKVGGKVSCVNLGVEGDTATHVHAFARYKMYKDRQNKYKAHYLMAQEATMNAVRKELEFKKRPKAERSEEEQDQIARCKLAANANLEKIRLARDEYSAEFTRQLDENVIEVTSKVFTHVTIQFGEERITTKRSHGASFFRFNQFEIKCSTTLNEDALTQDF
ncbi:DUF342 domain-containing protein [Vibrio renipiscarius]|uniref:Polymerase n=1 Tax=Vibrio renipiscarius TaxID=1461322 RepID=A0A0C2NV58_9VIBR|nr:FapA family protein [Vibrio renipiscarius]KII76436.1 polymerase [Vibrio renipiscarius]KII78042.1 polymerase [Vibrio renipiscarius]